MKEKQDVCIFLQVRLDSLRLPRKALLDLKGKTVIEHAMTALRYVPAKVYALVTDKESAPDLKPLAESCGFAVFIGPKDDVLKRYALAAKHFNADVIVRATGDNPLVSPDLASLLISRCINRRPDYAGFLGMLLGIGVELLSRDALDTAAADAVDPYEREHVSPFIIRRPGRFCVYRPLAPDAFRYKARVTLDTREDYEFIKLAFSDLYTGRPIPSLKLVDWLKAPNEAGQLRLCCVH